MRDADLLHFEKLDGHGWSLYTKQLFPFPFLFGNTKGFAIKYPCTHCG